MLSTLNAAKLVRNCKKMFKLHILMYVFCTRYTILFRLFRLVFTVLQQPMNRLSLRCNRLMFKVFKAPRPPGRDRSFRRREFIYTPRTKKKKTSNSMMAVVCRTIKDYTTPHSNIICTYHIACRTPVVGPYQLHNTLNLPM